MKKLNGGVYAGIIAILQLQAVLALVLALALVLESSSSIDSISGEAEDVIPTPSPWPDQFHALLYMNLSSSGHLQIANLWYDWPRGRNVNIIQKQLGVLLYDVEWNNGTSFYYTLQQQEEEGGNGSGTCQITEFEVGIPRPDFLDGAKYLGTQLTDGFLCNVWEKVDFIWYYEDVLTNLPVRWDFYDGISTHVITFEVGAVLQDSVTQAPAYCFKQQQDTAIIKRSLQLEGQKRLRFLH